MRTSEENGITNEAIVL